MLSQSIRAVDSRLAGGADAWVTRPAADEAQDLYRMVRYGNCTIAGIRELIAVPPNIEAALLAYAHRHPEDASRIGRALRFRVEVRREFDQLVDMPSLLFPERIEDAAAADDEEEAVSADWGDVPDETLV
jgi:hypothetical protein